MPARKVGRRQTSTGAVSAQVTSSAEELLLAAMENGQDPSKTGRFLMTYKEGATENGLKHLKSHGSIRVANARDFKGQAVSFEAAGDADALVFPEIGVALVTVRAQCPVA